MKNIILILVLFAVPQFLFAQNCINGQFNVGPTIIRSFENHLEKANPNTAIGVSFTFLYDLSEHFDVTLKSSYLTWDANENTWNNNSFSSDNQNISILAGLRYYLINSQFKPYLAFENGYTYYNKDVAGKSSLSKKLNDHDIRHLGSHNNYSFGFGIGTVIKLSKSINLDLNISAQHPKEAPEYYSFSIGVDMGLFSF